VLLEAWPAGVLPQLRRRPGVSRWRVADHVDALDDDEDVAVRWHARFDAAQALRMAHALPSLWPPGEAQAKAWRLDKCSRFLPHDQVKGGGDGGGGVRGLTT
jgi:hypothetical protein